MLDILLGMALGGGALLAGFAVAEIAFQLDRRRRTGR